MSTTKFTTNNNENFKSEKYKSVELCFGFFSRSVYSMCSSAASKARCQYLSLNVAVIAESLSLLFRANASRFESTCISRFVKF